MNAPILIATAGHVDHGKSTLVQVLTGIDPDRWEAEKRRGITIDLGYAHVTREGRTYSFIDVPGHERFIHNMLAGIGSIDAVLFVIAADESIMPQTREHALALRYLGVEQVHVVITKVDLVDEELLELLHMEIDEWLEENGWPEATKVAFSSKQPETTAAVMELMQSLEKKTASQRSGFRLSIDRVFTSPGSGTVLTGTVDRGGLGVEQAVFIQPLGLEGRIRQLQLHGVSADRVGPHTRVALNLGGVHYSELVRGNCVFTQSQPRLSRKILVRLNDFEENWLPSTRHEFHLHHLAARLNARMLWRENEVAALELRAPYGFWALDRGLIRDGSPMRVFAGFEVLEPELLRGKRRQGRALTQDLPEPGDLLSWQRWYLQHERGLLNLNLLTAKCGEPLVAEMQEQVVPVGDQFVLAKTAWTRYQQEFKDGLAVCHTELPIFQTIPLSGAHNYFKDKHWPPQLVDFCFQWAGESETIVIEKDRLRLVGVQPSWTPHQKDLLKSFLAPLQEGLAVVDLKLIRADRARFAMIERLLIWEKYLINLTPELLIHHEFLNRITETLAKRFSAKPFRIQELKEAFDFSRKYAIPLLEYLDKLGYTRREDDSRVWIARELPRWACSWSVPGR